jgi:hypothetical protein
MTVFFKARSSCSISLEEFLDYLDTEIDFNDVASIKEAFPMLQKLAQDPDWYIEFLNKDLMQNMSSDEVFSNRYTSNSIILAESSVKNQYAIRANTWLPAGDSLRQGTNKRFFAEDLLHDHTFDLMTVGLLGPGYKTEIFHYEYEDCVGYCGEAVEAFDRRSYQLERTSVLFMEKNSTIHRQLPPDEMSVSLNLMCQNLCDPMRRQYEFEERGPGTLGIKSVHYSSVQNPVSTESLINICASFCNENSKSLLVDLYNRLGERPELNESSLILLRTWFRELGITESELAPLNGRITKHLSHAMDSCPL